MLGIQTQGGLGVHGRDKHHQLIERQGKRPQPRVVGVIEVKCPRATGKFGKKRGKNAQIRVKGVQAIRSDLGQGRLPMINLLFVVSSSLADIELP